MKKYRWIEGGIKYDFSQYVNFSLYEQIKLADTKAALIFSVLGVVTAAILSQGIKIDWAESNIIFTLILIGIATILIVVSAKSIFFVLYPRFKKGKTKGILYFGDIMNYNKKEYADKGISLSNKEIIKELYEQSHILSGIVDKKFSAVRHAMITTAITIAYMVLFLALI